MFAHWGIGTMASSKNARAKITSWRQLQFAALMTAGAFLGLVSSAQAADYETGATNQQLLQKMDAMEQRIKSLEAKLKEKEASPAPPKSSTEITSNLKPQNKANKIQSAAAVSDTAAAAPSLPEQSANKNQPNKSGTPSPTPTAPSDNGILGVTASPVPGLSIGAYGEVQFGWLQNPAAGGQWQLGSDAARRLVLLPTYAITDNTIGTRSIPGARQLNWSAILKSTQSCSISAVPWLDQPASRADRILQRPATGTV
jgi:hypothetical protein